MEEGKQTEDDCDSEDAWDLYAEAEAEAEERYRGSYAGTVVSATYWSSD